MAKENTITPYSFKRKNAYYCNSRAGVFVWKNISLCGAAGTTREKHCQLFKLALLSVLPALILIGQTTTILIDKVQLFAANTNVKDNIQFSVELGLVVHTLQIERGTTALYVSSNGDSLIYNRLLGLYQNSDIAISSLSKWISIDEPSHFHSRDLFRKEITKFRLELNPQIISIKQVIEFYANDIAAFIQMISRSINVEEPFTFWTDITAYQMLIFSKEQAGMERALGSTYYARGQFSLQDLLWYKEKSVLGESYLQKTLEISLLARNLLNSMFTNTLLAQYVDNMRQHILNNSLLQPSTLSGTIWFDNMTAYINILKTVQDKLAYRIIKNANDDNTALKKALILSAVELAVTVVMIPIIIVMVRKIINKIHVFSTKLKKETDALNEERKRTEELLYQILPKSIAQKLMLDGYIVPEAYHSATILFSDVVEFTTISSRSTPMQVINMLNHLYVTVDNRLEKFDVYKVETIGDGFMIASGLPNRNGDQHVEQIARLSLEFLSIFEEMQIPHLQNEKMKLRIGFNTGPCVAGVVGVKMPKYCVFGDTVNTASRMESTGLPQKVHITESSACKLKDKFIVTERGCVDVKGKGKMRTFWLEGLIESDNIEDSRVTEKDDRFDSDCVTVKQY